jgi:hypothetical protein
MRRKVTSKEIGAGGALPGFQRYVYDADDAKYAPKVATPSPLASRPKKRGILCLCCAGLLCGAVLAVCFVAFLAKNNKDVSQRISKYGDTAKEVTGKYYQQVSENYQKVAEKITHSESVQRARKNVKSMVQNAVQEYEELRHFNSDQPPPPKKSENGDIKKNSAIDPKFQNRYDVGYGSILKDLEKERLKRRRAELQLMAMEQHSTNNKNDAAAAAANRGGLAHGLAQAAAAARKELHYGAKKPSLPGKNAMNTNVGGTVDESTPEGEEELEEDEEEEEDLENEEDMEDAALLAGDSNLLDQGGKEGEREKSFVEDTNAAAVKPEKPSAIDSSVFDQQKPGGDIMRHGADDALEDVPGEKEAMEHGAAAVAVEETSVPEKSFFRSDNTPNTKANADKLTSNSSSPAVLPKSVEQQEQDGPDIVADAKTPDPADDGPSEEEPKYRVISESKAIQRKSAPAVPPSADVKDVVPPPPSDAAAAAAVGIASASQAVVKAVPVPRSCRANEKALMNAGSFKAGQGQDRFVMKILNGKQHGFFIEFGAGDGVYQSTTNVFEKHMCWTGLCIEPSEVVFKELVKNRPGCTRIHGAVCDGDMTRMYTDVVDDNGQWTGLSGFKEFMTEPQKKKIERQVNKKGWSTKTYPIQCYKLNDLVEKYHTGKYDKTVDFLSIDVEGYEREVVESIDWKERDYGVVQVETNVEELTLDEDHAGLDDVRAIRRIFKKLGYLGRPGESGVDDFFIHPQVLEMAVEARRKKKSQLMRGPKRSQRRHGRRANYPLAPGEDQAASDGYAAYPPPQWQRNRQRSRRYQQVTNQQGVLQGGYGIPSRRRRGRGYRGERGIDEEARKYRDRINRQYMGRLEDEED